MSPSSPPSGFFFFKNGETRVRVPSITLWMIPEVEVESELLLNLGLHNDDQEEGRLIS